MELLVYNVFVYNFVFVKPTIFLKEEINIELIALCLSKDGSAQRKLYNLLLPYLNAMSKRYLYDQSFLKDALQETFIRIFKSLGQFDVQKASFKTWCTKIAIHSCLRQNEKNKNNRVVEYDSSFHEQMIQENVFDKMTLEETQEWLKQMPKNYFEVFNLFVIDEFTHEEIAEMLSIKIELSRKRLSRARTWVKKRLQNDPDLQFKFSYN